LVALVRNEIVPHYAKLTGAVRLSLLRIADTDSYLALQHWTSRAEREAAITSEFYPEWFKAYEPILARWDQLMVFEDEWETEVLL
jgi:quinol monooxygenase YgiN